MTERQQTPDPDIVASVGDGVISIDAQQRIVGFNAGAERLFGYCAEEILGQPLSGLLPPWAREDHEHTHVPHFEREQTRERDMGPRSGLRGYRKDGTEFPAEVTISHTGSTSTAVFTAVVRDITDRQAVSIELEGRSHFVNAVLETVGALVVVLDARGRIELFNRACETLTGRRSSEVIGTPVWMLVPPDERSRLRAAFEPLDRVVARQRNHFSTINDTPRLIEWTNTTLRSPQGCIEHIIATGIDITDQQRLEDQLVQASKMELVGRVAGGIAHDFNNILAVVSLRLDRLEGRHADRRSRHDVVQMRQALDRATDLISDMMSFSRQQRMHLVGLDVNDEIEAIADILDDLLGVDIDLVLDLDATPAVVVADRSRLAQVIVNLAVNARDAMPNGGTLSIRTYNRRTDADPVMGTGDFVCADVSDTGLGMDDHTLRHAFEPFFTTKADMGGTGLGLATIHGIVTQSEGHISVDSEQGTGTCFTICLPKGGEASSVNVHGDDRMSAGPPEPATVLVVEDEDELRALIVEELELIGYRAIGVADAAAAESHDPKELDLLLTDVVIPGVSGPELAARFLAERPDLPVVFTTGYAQTETGEMLPPAAPVLEKPFSIQELRQIVRAALA